MGGGEVALDLLFGLLLGLLGLLYRNHINAYEADKAKSSKQREEDLKLLAERRAEDRVFMQHELNNIRDWSNGKFGDGNGEFKQLWEDIKAQRTEQDRKNSEFWLEVKEFRERQRQMELSLAKDYVSKDDMNQMLANLTTKLDAILREIKPN